MLNSRSLVLPPTRLDFANYQLMRKLLRFIPEGDRKGKRIWLQIGQLFNFPGQIIAQPAQITTNEREVLKYQLEAILLQHIFFCALTCSSFKQGKIPPTLGVIILTGEPAAIEYLAVFTFVTLVNGELLGTFQQNRDRFMPK
jgi:hypothetical protein